MAKRDRELKQRLDELFSTGSESPPADAGSIEAADRPIYGRPSSIISPCPFISKTANTPG